MKKYFLLLILSLATLNADVGHQSSGSSYGTSGVEAYAEVRHGPDGALFLDPCFIPELTKLKNQHLLDVGCGAGPWSIHAAKHGAIVSALDIQEKMIFQAMGIHPKSQFNRSD